MSLESPALPEAVPPQAESLFDADEYIEEWGKPEDTRSGEDALLDADADGGPEPVAGVGSQAAARLGLFERLFAGSGPAGADVAPESPVPSREPDPVESDPRAASSEPVQPAEEGVTELAPPDISPKAGEKTAHAIDAAGPDAARDDVAAQETSLAAEPLADAVDDQELADSGAPGASSPGRHVRRRKFGHARRSASSKPVAPLAEGVAEVDAAATSDSVATVETIDPQSPPKHPNATVGRVRAAAIAFGKRAMAVFLIVVLLLASLFGLTLGLNALARWNAKRVAALNAAPSSPAEDNLLVIGVTDGVAVGFTALKAERSSKRVLGIAIPDGAFMEVPGQGFERVGASFVGGPGVSKDAVSNYLGVPFHNYVVMDGVAYQAMLKGQTVNGIMSGVRSTDLNADQRSALTQYFASVNTKDVWIVPLPVKPVAVGDQRYFEPQRAQVADLLLQWWGVQPGQQKATPRVIVYNGVGTPGLAGLASQQLIRAGLRVVDSGNADNFKHQTTLILVYHGTEADAQAVKNAIGVGQILVQSASQDLTDMIVIIGTDYRPPTTDASTVPTEGVQ
jgi:type IV secretory pathway TrbD component